MKLVAGKANFSQKLCKCYHPQASCLTQGPNPELHPQQTYLHICGYHTVHTKPPFNDFFHTYKFILSSIHTRVYCLLTLQMLSLQEKLQLHEAFSLILPKFNVVWGIHHMF